LLIDVRERGEFAQHHIPGAEPLGRGILDITIERLAPDPDTSIILYCSGGNRSAIAADTLQRMGYTNIRTIAGGLAAWIKADLPTSSAEEVLD